MFTVRIYNADSTTDKVNVDSVWQFVLLATERSFGPITYSQEKAVPADEAKQLGDFLIAYNRHLELGILEAN